MVGARYFSPGMSELFQTTVLQSPVSVGLPAMVPAEVTQANVAAADTLMKSFMVREGVSAGQLAICRGGKILLSNTYATKPPHGYEPVTRMSLFRIASCSKMFTCAGITVLRSRGDVDMDAKVFPVLGIDTPAIRKDKPDPRINEITVKHLVDHAGGWNDHESCVAKDGTHVPGTEWDPMFAARQMALEMNLNRPPSRQEIAQYMYGKKLQFAPGTQDFRSTDSKSYSNLGYMLLGLVIEKVSGQAYMDFLHNEVGKDSDTSNVFLSKLMDGVKDPREVWYISPGSAPTQLKPRSSDLLPSAYGGDFIPELHDGAGGLMTNAETLAQFSFHYAVWGLGRRAAGYTRSGSLPGTSSFTYSRPNGIDCGFVLNTREFNGGPKRLEEFSSSLQGLLDKA